MWLDNYLRGRRQRGRFGSSSSTVSYGVPQGSILGPNLFVTLTFNLPEALGLDEDKDGIVIYNTLTMLTIWHADKSPAIGQKGSPSICTSTRWKTPSLLIRERRSQYGSAPAPPPTLNIGSSLPDPSSG